MSVRPILPATELPPDSLPERMRFNVERELTLIKGKQKSAYEGRISARYAALAAPTGGKWVQGDVVRNSAPAVASGVILYGWLCTVTGDPGTWEPLYIGNSAGAPGSGTVTNFSASGTEGVTTNVTDPTTTPALAIGLGAITPSSVAASGAVSGSNLSGTNTGDQLTFKTLAVSGQSDVVADAAADTLTLVAGSGIAITTNAAADAVTIAATAAAGALVAGQIEVDFGTTPVADATFTVSVSSVISTSIIVAAMSSDAPTGKDADEVEMDYLDIRCKAGTGLFTMFVSAANDALVADKFKINYHIG